MNHQEKVISSYQRENFADCLRLINQTSTTVQGSPHYKILTAICLVKMRTNFGEAHRLIDEVIQKDINNAFAFFAKGQAFYEEKKLSQAIFCLGKAIELDVTGSMARAKVLKSKATKTLKELGIDAADIKEESSDKENDDNDSKGALKAESSDEKTKHCSVCDKTFSKHFSLRRHMALHTGERPHACSQCGFAFIQKSDLKRHQATHSDEHNYECAQCEKRFKTQKNLHGHSICHVTERPFQCRVCPKTFKLNKLRTYHEILHESEKPFGCDHCDKRFRSKTYVKSHVKLHIEKKPFGCNLCLISFATIERLSSHYQRFHT
jgi:C2H2-type zinc finger/Zinc finger, C2H2 type/Zinc-finger of C2H2 type